MAACGVVGMLAAVGLTEPALAFQSPGERPSMLGPGSSGEMPKSATESEPVGSQPAVEKTKLTQQDVRELNQALRQLQAAVQAEHRSGGGSVEVKVQRPARSVTAPT
jgi:hypothetical protein